MSKRMLYRPDLHMDTYAARRNIRFMTIFFVDCPDAVQEKSHDEQNHTFRAYEM